MVHELLCDLPLSDDVRLFVLSFVEIVEVLRDCAFEALYHKNNQMVQYAQRYVAFLAPESANSAWFV